MPLKRTEKLVLMLDEVELKVLDDWRYMHRMPSRAAAVRALMELGYVLDAQNSHNQMAADPPQCGTAASPGPVDEGTPAL